MNKKHMILVPLYAAPPLLTYVASTYLALGDNVRSFPLFAIAALCLVAIYFRGLYLEERNEYLEPLAPTPLWGKRLPRWARDTLPPTAPPPLRLLAREPFEEPSRTRMRKLEWPSVPGDVPSAPTVSSDLDAEVTLTEPKAS